MTVRTRFAPSPTGYLHIGGARTALYCWLQAHKTQGKFILRIEDTDRERSTKESIDAILDSMQWLGLDYDEGPFYQTQRFARYDEVREQLLAEGNAYRCYCSKERLAQLRETQQANKQKPRYDGRCRHLPTDEQPTDVPHVIRFKNPQEGDVVVYDLIRGRVVFNNTELDDLIIARSDGTPTYNFTVVIDDWDMHVTHVIRGDDHLNNTPRQMNILQALGAEVPVYAHVPMILGKDGKRLSKRHGAVSVMQYRDEGYLPQALLNYLVRLGWSHGDQEIFSLDEMKKLFEVTDVNKAAASFDPDKLLWLNQQHMMAMAPEELARHLEWYMQQASIDYQHGPQLAEVAAVLSARCKTLVEMAERSRCFYVEVDGYDEAAAQKHLTAEAANVLRHVHGQLNGLGDWEKASIHQVIKDSAEALGLKMGKVAQPIRVAVTGNTISPSIDDTLRLLGKERCLERLDKAVWFIREQGGETASN